MQNARRLLARPVLAALGAAATIDRLEDSRVNAESLTGLVTGLVLTWWRSRDPLLTSLLLVLGAALAAAVMALTGHLLGPGDPATALRAAKVGAQVPLRLEVDTYSVYLVWPIAVLAGALVVLLNSAGPTTSEVARGTTEPQ